MWLDPAFRDWNIEEYLAPIAAPILVIQCDDDEYGTWAQVDAIARQAAGPVRTLALAGCGHTPHKDRRAETVDAIAGFVRELRGG